MLLAYPNFIPLFIIQLTIHFMAYTHLLHPSCSSNSWDGHSYTPQLAYILVM